jgi:hypothetical protein
MWTRREGVMFATTAAATFGLTLAAVYPRLANAVDAAAAATVEVKTPTLDLGTAQVSAARDEADGQLIVMTVKNITAQPTKAEFLAQVMETAPISELSRTKATATPAWSQEISCDLKAGETQTVKVTLPAAKPEAKANPGQNQQLLIAGTRYLSLSGKAEPKQTIVALNFAAKAQEQEVVSLVNPTAAR